MNDTVQFLPSPNGILTVGKPYLWKSEVYGDTAVHITGFSPNEQVAIISIDGGEASKQAQHHAELSDGIYFVSIESGRLGKRAGTRVKNTIREVPSVGKVVIVETMDGRRAEHANGSSVELISTPPALQEHIMKNSFLQSIPEKAPKRKRRMNLAQALEAAEDYRGEFNWAYPSVETF